MFTKVKKASDLSQLLRKLGNQGPINAQAVALMLTERNFRGSFFRIAELCYSAIVVYLFRRDPAVTLGHSQVSFPYWRRRYGKNNASLLLATLSEVASYELCCIYLETNRRDTLRELLICYNGKPSKLYATLFIENLGTVRQRLAQLRLPTV
jgi:hypothetical protein